MADIFKSQKNTRLVAQMAKIWKSWNRDKVSGIKFFRIMLRRRLKVNM
jgi:hypothetical protein